VTDEESQSANPDTISVGDRFEFTAQLLKNGQVIGHQSAACTVVQASHQKHTNLCVGTSILPGGTISGQGYSIVGGNAEALPAAITGGTGIYRDARGQVEVEPLGNARYKVTFELS
jgi:hypothetical protein